MAITFLLSLLRDDNFIKEDHHTETDSQSTDSECLFLLLNSVRVN